MNPNERVRIDPRWRVAARQVLRSINCRAFVRGAGGGREQAVRWACASWADSWYVKSLLLEW